MSYDQWMSFAGVEVWNSARTTAYLKNGYAPAPWAVSDCFCPGLQGALGDEDYENPFYDQAPWVDPAYPESYNFAGYLVESVEGLEGSPFTRNVIESPSGGGTLGRLRMRPRTITISLWVFGANCCAVAYGIKWLGAALRGQVCGGRGSCSGDEMCFFECCPEPCYFEEDEDGNLILDENGAAISSCVGGCTHDGQLRAMCDVGLTNGPEVIERIDPGCGCGGCGIARVEVQLTAANPWKFTTLREVITDAEFDRTTDDECDTNFWVKCDDPGYDDPCVVDDCLEDPNCPIPVPPELPRVFDPCYDACLIENGTRLCSTISSDELGVPGDWFQAVPYIVVKAGSKPARNIIVRFYENPLERPCEDVVGDNCNACAAIGITYIPAGGSLIIDGRCCEVLLTCGAISRNGLRNTFNPDDGGPFSCPVMECVPLCVCISGDLDELAEDATISVMVAGREN